MKQFLVKHKRLLIDIAVLIGTFIFIFASYFIFKPLYFKSVTHLGSTDGVITRIYIFTCIAALFITGLVLKIKDKLSIETLLFLIFMLGVLMQLDYMLITPYNYRQHDVFSLSIAGHEGYALTIFKTGSLPTQVDRNGNLDYQFYHPPFNAFMQALMMRISIPFMKLYNFISGSNYYDVQQMENFTMDGFKEAYQYVDNYRVNNPSYNPLASQEAWNAAKAYANPVHLLYQTSEILSAFYMSIALFFAIKIAYKLKVNNKFKALGALFVALFPAMFLLAGQENNDPLCIMNCFIVIYFTVRWWEKHTYFNAAMIGLFTGLAMFAKLSGALIAVPAIVAFAFVLIQNIIKKDGNFKHQLIQGAMIGLIIAPIGLWFHIYAKVRFDQPFGFVFSNLWDALYVGNHSFFARFINIFDFKDLFLDIWGRTVYDRTNNIPNNYNLPNFLIKSALFGEYSFMNADALAILSLIFNYLFVYLSLILMIIYFICSKKEHLEIKIIGGVIIVSQLLAQLYFNIKMPYGCTMDFRYIVPIILGFMILNTLAFDKFSKEKGWKHHYSMVTMIVTCCFLASISIFYLAAI